MFIFYNFKYFYDICQFTLFFNTKAVVKTNTIFNTKKGRKVPAAPVAPVLLLLFKHLVISHEIGKEDEIVAKRKTKNLTLPEQFKLESQITANGAYPFILAFLIICDTATL